MVAISDLCFSGVKVAFCDSYRYGRITGSLAAPLFVAEAVSARCIIIAREGHRALVLSLCPLFYTCSPSSPPGWGSTSCSPAIHT
jgi:hypothetical protein